MDKSPLRGQGPVKSICFVVDQPGWAFDRWTSKIAARLRELGIHTTRCFQNFLPARFSEDVIYACWWPDVEQIVPRISGSQRILARITDMLTWNHNAPMEWQERFAGILPHVSWFVASSDEIRRTLRKMDIRYVSTIPDCVDSEEFFAGGSRTAGKAKIGWCGNPRALHWMGFDDVKGFSAVQSLRGIDYATLDVASHRSMHEMPAWYRDIDILVCASRAEGTPLPVLEAMSSGKIVISTAVGLVPEISSAGLFVFDGTASDLQRCLTGVLDRKEEWESLGMTNRHCVVNEYSPETAAFSMVELFSNMTSKA